MANQVIVTNTGNVQVALTPPPNVQVQISRAAIGTVSNVPTANFANYAANVTSSSQPNITSLGTLTALNVAGNGTVNNLTVTGNLSVGNLFANNANYANFANIANIANTANSVAVANVVGIGNIATINLDGNASNILFGNGIFSAIPVVSNVANANYANFAGNAFNVSGSNVTGAVANANYAANAGNATIANSANSVTLANVSGAGNIASINLDGNVANLLTGNGTFVAIPTVSANANYANFAGQVVDATQSNITTVGTLTNVITSGQVTSTRAGNASDGGGQLYLNGSGNNRIDYNTNGTGAPATTTRSAGTKITLYPALSGSQTDYAMGIDAATMWSSVPVSSPSFKFKWYGNTTEIANLDGTGNLSVAGNVTASNINGNVANANYANFAGTAYSVSGANVSGEVANANYALYANIANTANSVALANVVGIGNIANINLDGSSSNVLFGNGVFAPESTSIANANYANFAGNLINGTSNITIPVANGNVNISSNGVANILSVLANGVTFITPPTTVNGALTIDSFGNPANDVHRINSRRARGNATTPLSVNPNDATMRFLTWGYNGSAYQTNSLASIRALVDANYTANGANIPLGWSIQVNDTNGGTNNQARTHNFWANGNVSLNNVIFADGGGLSNITGANVTGQVAYAAVANSVAVANVSGIGNIATINLDGNASNVLFGNGVFAPESTSIANANYANFAGNALILANGTSNISIPTANANILFSTAGNANVVDIQAIGTFNVKPPAQGPLSAIRIDTYGRSGNVGAQRINSTRYRGNATSPLSVQANDFTMELLTVGYNGSAVQTNSIASFNAIVDSSYSTNGANIPLGWQLRVNDTNGGINNQSKIHNFYSNGTVNFANSITVSGTGNISIGNITANGGNYAFSNSTGGKTSVDLFGDKTVNSFFGINDAQFGVTMSNVDTTTGFSPFRFQQYAPTNNQFGTMFMYRARGTDFFSSAPVVAGDKIYSIGFIVNSNNVTTGTGGFSSQVTYNDNAGNVGMQINLDARGTGTVGYDNGIIILDAHTTSANNFTANNFTVNSGGNINYDRQYIEAYSTQDQTNPTANAENLMSFNNTGISNGISIVTNGTTLTRITMSKAGVYNIQFSAQLNQTTGGAHNAFIWLKKNGTTVADSAGDTRIAGNGDRIMAAWNYIVNAAAGDYYELAWSADDTNVLLDYVAAAGIVPAIPSVILTVVPVGA